MASLSPTSTSAPTSPAAPPTPAAPSTPAALTSPAAPARSVASVPSARFGISSGKPGKREGDVRVKQKGLGDHGNCFFYAAKMVILWTKVSGEQQDAYRCLKVHRRVIASYAENEWYKRMTVINCVKAIAEYQSITLDDSQKTKEWIVQSIPIILTVIKSQKSIRSGTLEIAEAFITQFKGCKHTQLEHLYQEQMYRERIANHLRFLETQIPEITKVINERLLVKQALRLYPEGSWSHLPIQRQYNLLHEMFIERAAVVFGLEPARWNPLQPIDDLIGLLQVQTNGALLAAGVLGKGCVSSSPVPIKSDEHCQYYGWKPGTYTAKERSTNGHYVVIVKVEKTPQEMVYFLDPADDSEPGTKRIVYMLSYAKFCSHLSDFTGRLHQSRDALYLWQQKESPTPASR